MGSLGWQRLFLHAFNETGQVSGNCRAEYSEQKHAEHTCNMVVQVVILVTLGDWWLSQKVPKESGVWSCTAPLRYQGILLSPLIPEVQIKDLIALTCHDQLLPFTDCEVLNQKEFLEHIEQPKVSRCHTQTQTRHGPQGGCVAMSPGLQWLVLFGLPGILRRLESTQMRPNICSRWDLSICWWLTFVHLFSSRSSRSSDLQNPWLRRQRLPWCLWIRWRALEGSQIVRFDRFARCVFQWNHDLYKTPEKILGRSLPDSPGSQVIGTAKAKDIMAVHCELRRSEKEAEITADDEHWLRARVVDESWVIFNIDVRYSTNTMMG